MGPTGLVWSILVWCYLVRFGSGLGGTVSLGLVWFGSGLVGSSLDWVWSGLGGSGLGLV